MFFLFLGHLEKSDEYRNTAGQKSTCTHRLDNVACDLIGGSGKAMKDPWPWY